jgi:Arc/MetJ-type ribon-helix-helix transcriptional regulator
MDSFDVPLTDDLRAHVDLMIDQGGYPDAGTYIRALIEWDYRQLVKLHRQLDEGEASGPSGKTFDEIIAGIKGRHASRAT